MALYPVAGCRISIGTAVDPASADLAVADFQSITTWKEIKGWTQMGDFGDTAELISTQVINSDRDRKMKGTKNAGSMQNVFASDPSDEGQLALIAASKTKSNYPIKIELNDKPAEGTAPKNGIRYFHALVMNAVEAGGGANAVRNLNSTLEINSN
ncbi:phage tail tube protein, partial [Rhizobiaceae sp. 2RAB30]